jgi:hypothetical protein
MVNVLRCTQVLFTQSLLRPDMKHNARTSNVKMHKTFLILAPMHVPFRAEREQLHRQYTGRFNATLKKALVRQSNRKTFDWGPPLRLGIDTYQEEKWDEC